MSRLVRKTVVSTKSARERMFAPRDRNLLIVEPERLLRWSLVTYLSRWFNVFPVESREDADRLLDVERIDAVVVSDELAAHGAGAVEQHAVQRNPSVRVVHVVMSLRGEDAVVDPCNRIEKPFELAKLARLLGVHNGSVRPDENR
jgi:DNA-binding NtrC family response regulator